MDGRLMSTEDWKRGQADFWGKRSALRSEDLDPCPLSFPISPTLPLTLQPTTTITTHCNHRYNNSVFLYCIIMDHSSVFSQNS
uniref:Uncharacterized protein n=1 Tax=Onchocerca volvulus TaxID=6282 RepID=A0A8R1XWD4_ONCVO